MKGRVKDRTGVPGEDEDGEDEGSFSTGKGELLRSCNSRKTDGIVIQKILFIKQKNTDFKIKHMVMGKPWGKA